jgi:hypothetical protein
MLPKPDPRDSACPPSPDPEPRSTNYARELLPWFEDARETSPRTPASTLAGDFDGSSDEPTTGRIPFLIF